MQMGYPRRRTDPCLAIGYGRSRSLGRGMSNPTWSTGTDQVAALLPVKPDILKCQSGTHKEILTFALFALDQKISVDVIKKSGVYSQILGGN